MGKIKKKKKKWLWNFFYQTRKSQNSQNDDVWKKDEKQISNGQKEGGKDKQTDKLIRRWKKIYIKKGRWTND